MRQSLQKEHDKAEALASELARARRDIETQLALSSKAADEAAQLKQAAESATELRQSLQKEHDRAEALAGELARARRDIETSAGAGKQGGRPGGAAQAGCRERDAELRQSLQKEHDRAEALSSELGDGAAGHRDSNGAGKQGGRRGAQLKQAAASATAELRQSLQKEHDRAEALASELAMARRDIETQMALASKAGDETAQLKQAAESATAELRQSLQKEHERAEALASELAMAQRDTETQLALASKRATRRRR